MSFGIPVRNGLGLGLTPSTMLSSGQPGGRPALLLNFIGTTSLSSTVTFSRTSNATLVDSTGALTYAPNNLNTYSEQFDNAAWSKSAATITANAIAAPNGSATADKLVEDLTTAGHYTGQSFSAVAGYSYVFSAYAKAGERTFLQLVLASIGSPTANAVSCFDLVNGTVTSNTGGQTAAITPVGNGWYRCSIALKSALTATTNTQLRLSTTSTTSAASYTGDGTSGAYIWGAQFEQATYQTTPSTYNSTTPANLVGYTQEFDNAAWTKTAATITANAATAPDGTLSADKIIATAVSTTHSAGQNLTVISGTTFTGSVYAKAGEYNFAAVLLLTTFAAAQIVICDLSNGTIASSSGSPLATSVTDVGNGWYRISITQVTNAAGTATMQVRPSNVGTTTAFTGDGTSGVYIWGAQLSNSASVDPYVYNPAAALTSTAYYGPRFDYDPTTLVSKGLLIEEQRTNLFLNSKIDGTNLATQNVTTTATAYTISFYGTGTITLTGTSTAGPIVGAGAYPTRTTLTFTPTAGTLTCTVTGTVQYAQIEAGAFATSYIPTAAATVTRAADIATMAGTNFSSWYNQSAGTFVAGMDTLYSNASDLASIRSVFTADDGTANNLNRIYQYANLYGANTTVGGVSQADIPLSVVPINTPATAAYAYAVNDFSAASNGTLGTPDTSGSLPTPTRLSIGATVPVNGHVRFLTYYPQRLPDTTLQALTS